MCINCTGESIRLVRLSTGTVVTELAPNNTTKVTVHSGVVVIKPTVYLHTNETYKLVMTAGAVQLRGHTFNGVSNFRFSPSYSTSSNGMEIASQFPASGSAVMGVNGSITLVFSKSSVRYRVTHPFSSGSSGSSGTSSGSGSSSTSSSGIAIYQGLFQIELIAASSVSVENDVVTINPLVTLTADTLYELRITDGTFYSNSQYGYFSLSAYSTIFSTRPAATPAAAPDSCSCFHHSLAVQGDGSQLFLTPSSKVSTA